MSETIVILFQQLLQMVLYSVIGLLLFRSKLVTVTTSNALSNFLLYVILPCVIIRSFQLDRTPENIKAIAFSCLLGALALLLAMIVSAVCFSKRPIDWFSSSFSNAGFMGIPLVAGVIGQENVVYVAGMVAMLNALQWTVGQAVMQGDRRNVSLEAVVKSPLVLALAMGLALFVCGITLPYPMASVINGVAACNTPVAMIVLGVFLGQVQFKEILTDKNAFQCSFVRLLLIPVLTLLLFWAIPLDNYGMKMALLLAVCAPVGTNVAVYAQRLELDAGYAARTVCISTVLSVVTMPLLYMMAILLL